MSRMRFVFVIWLIVAAAPAGFAATTASTNAPAAAPAAAPANPTDISAFKIISDRNIFNPNRYTRTVRTNDRPRVVTPQSHVEHVALVGTMTYQKGQLAFFDGTSSDVRKPLKVSDTVAGYRLVAIYPDRVKLGVGASHFDLAVGKELRRADGGNWSIADQPESTASYSSSSSSSSSERSGRGSGRNYSGRNGGSSSRETAGAATNAPPAGAQNEEVMFDESGDFPAPQTRVSQEIIRIAPGPGATPPAEPGAAVSAPPAAAEAPGGEVNPVLLRLMQQRQQEENR